MMQYCQGELFVRYLTRILLLVAVTILAVEMARSITIAQRSNIIWIDDRPTPLYFARGFDAFCHVPKSARNPLGIDDPQYLPYYRSLGFNTVLITITSTDGEYLLQAEELAKASAKAGCFLLVEFAVPEMYTRSGNDWSGGMLANAHSESYRDIVYYYLDQVVPHFADKPNLVGYLLSTVRDRYAISDVGTFGEFLEAKYGTLANLTDAWTVQNSSSANSSYKVNPPPVYSFNALTASFANLLMQSNSQWKKLIEPDLNFYEKSVKERDADFIKYLQGRYKNIDELNARWDFKFPKWDDFKTEAIMTRENTVPGSSTISMLELARYRIQTAALARELWVKMLGEYDRGHLIFAGHQDSYRNIPGINTSINGIVTECYPGVAEADTTTHNVQAIDIARRGNQFAVLAGLQLRNADPGQFSNYLYDAATHGAAGIEVNDYPQLIGNQGLLQAWKNTIGDINARGLINRTPTPQVACVYSPYAPGPGSGRAHYGYLLHFLYGGPGSLFYILNEGTSYGQIDYISVDDLLALPIARYRTILLPSVLDLPQEAQLALVKFVFNGGTVVADVGLATMQDNGDMHSLPPLMRDLFGVDNNPKFTDTNYNLEVTRQHPRFPMMAPGLRSSGVQDDYMITHSALMTPRLGTDVLCRAVQTTTWQASSFKPMPRLELKPQCGIFVKNIGRGYATFASFPLYRFWLDGQHMWEEFHRDVFGFESTLRLEQPTQFRSPFSLVANYADGSLIAWTKIPIKPIVELENKKRQAYYAPSGLCTIGPRVTHFTFNNPGLHLAVPLPIWLQEAPGPVDFGVMQNNNQALLLTINIPSPADIGVVLLHITGGEYKVTPNSRHHVTIIGNPRVSDRDIVADETGILMVDISEPHCRVLIMPVATADSVTITTGDSPPKVIPVTATISYGDK